MPFLQVGGVSRTQASGADMGGWLHVQLSPGVLMSGLNGLSGQSANG